MPSAVLYLGLEGCEVVVGGVLKARSERPEVLLVLGLARRLGDER
jgi:hypothetical protein